MKIGNALKEISREQRIDSNAKYRLLGVKWYGKGVFLREEKYGHEIKATKLYQVKNGDFIYNRLFAWKSSFAIVPEEFDGCFVSNEFPLFICNTDKIVPEFLLNYILLPQNINSINNLSGGMSGISRKRFKEAEFLNFDIPEIKIATQRNTCNKVQQVSKIMSAQELESINQISFVGQLRQTILQEAIRGTFTAKWRKQHPELISGDNHVSKLLDKIKAEKENLIKEGKLKKEKPLPLITDKEKPFDLPQGWIWCRLGNISEWRYGKSLVKTQCKSKGKYPVFGSNGIVGYFDKYLTSKPSIVIGRKGSAGALNKSKMPSWTTDVAFYIEEIKYIDFDYLFILLKSLKINNIGKGIKPGINRNEAYNLLVPLAPANEQKAIVEKVTKIMFLIDQLEKQIAERKELSEMLMQAILREAFKY